MKKLLLILMALFLWAGSSIGQTQYTVVPTGGTAGNTNGTGADPVSDYYNSIRYQVVYTAAELTAAGMPANTQITRLAWNVTEVPGTLSNYTIYMGHTTATNSATHNVDATTLVKNAFSYVVATGYNDINFDTPFTWNGTSNIVVEICTGPSNPYASPYGGVQAKTGLTTSSRHYQVDGSSACAVNTSTTNTTKPYVRFTGQPATSPSLSAIPSSINFGYVASGNTYEYPTPYVLSGSNLTAGPIVVTAPAGFEVSLTGGGVGFGSSVNVTYTPPTLPATNIYIRFVPTGAPANYSGNITNVGGGASTNVAVSGSSDFFTLYCTSAATSTGDEDITQVTFGSTLNNTSPCASLVGSQGTATGTADLYSNFTSITPTDIGQGLSVPITVQITECAGTAYSHDVRVYIDFNQNGLLTDAGEETIIWAYASSNTHIINANINVPGGATLGNTLMRIVCKESSTTGPCLVSSYGETEDYKVNIITPPNYQLSWYNLQWPPTPTINQTQNVTVYAQCWESGVTEAAGPGTGIACWIGYGATGTNPNTWSNWVPATYNFGIDPNNNDEYQADLGALQSLTPGTYDFASRFQYLGGVMTYGGYNSGGGGAWDGTANVSGVLTVTPAVLPLTYTQAFPTSSFASYWTQTYSGALTSNRWSVSNTTNAGGTAYEMMCSFQNAIGVSRLISPALDFSTATDPWLIFRNYYNDYGTGATLKIQTSTDLVNWTDAWTYACGSGDIGLSGLGQNMYIDLPNTGVPTYVAWVVDGNHYQIDYWYVDNVTVQDGVPAAPGFWLGNTSTDWNTGSNWGDGNVPTNLVDALIPAGRPNYPVITSNATCRKLTINDGATVNMISSFFDIFTELSIDGGLTIDGGTVNVTSNIQQAGNGVITINGGNLNVNGYWGGPLFGGSWGGGVLNLNGGTIDLDGYLLLGSTAVNMAGPFAFHVHGDAIRFDGDYQTTPIGGTFFIEPLVAVTDVYIFNSDATGVMSFFDVIISAGTANIWLNPTWGSVSLSSNLFLVAGGDVSTVSSDGLLDMAALNIDHLQLDASNNVNFTTNTAPVTVSSYTGQALDSGVGYSSLISNGNITGNYSLFMTLNPLTTGRWILISPPVSGATAAFFNCQYLMKHDPITNTWSDIFDPMEPLIPGIDYALWVHPDVIVSGDPGCPNIQPNAYWWWSGTMNNGPVVASLLCDDPILEGWNNVGNPYQATIDWNATGWTKTNVNDAVYFENSGLWGTYIAGVGVNGGSQYIAPGQGFFVQCNNTAGGSLGFDPGIRTHTRGTFLKNSVANMIRLQASGNSLSMETVIRFSENATNGFDANYDAHMLFSDLINYPNVPQIYSMDNGYMAINALASAEQVPVGFKAGVDGVYTIDITENNDIATVILEDLLTGNITDLNTSSYTFNYTAGENEGRFIVHFKPLGISDNLATFVNVYSENRDVVITVPMNTEGQVFIYNMMGQQVANSTIDDVQTRIRLEQSANYLVEVISGDNAVTKKVFVK